MVTLRSYKGRTVLAYCFRRYADRKGSEHDLVFTPLPATAAHINERLSPYLDPSSRKRCACLAHYAGMAGLPRGS